MVQNSTNNFRFLIKHVPAAVAMFNENIEYIAYSDRWLKDYELGDQDLHGRSHYEVFPDILERWKQDHQDTLRGKVWRSEEEEWVRDDGSIVYIRAELRPWRNNLDEIKGIIMFTEVITDQVVTRKELEKKNEALKNKISDLRQKNKEVEEFSYIASHDLQEPLRIIQSYCDFIIDEYKDKLDETGKKSLEFVADSTVRMSKLIKGILAYSKLGRSPLSNAISCNNLVKSVIDFSIDKGEVGIESNIKVKSLPTVKGYRLELQMLFQNLISNAIKYVREGVTPEIEISCIDKEDHYEFCVSDNGIGIPKEHQDRVFKLFQRLHDRHAYAGIGIGLSHCKKIVSLHDGNIWVKGNKIGGSDFFFTINKQLE